MLNIAHIHVRGARSTPLTCSGCTALKAHAEHCASTRTHTSVWKVRYSIRTCRTPYTHIHTYSRRWVHVSGCTYCRPPYTHTYMHTRTKVHRSRCTCQTPYRTYTRVKCGSQISVLTLTAHFVPISSTRPHSTAHFAHCHALLTPNTVL